MADKISSTEVTQQKKVFVKSEEVLKKMEEDGQLEPFTDYYTPEETEMDILLNEIYSRPTLNDIYPIGSIYITVNNHQNPAKIFGGSWEQLKDCFLWGTGDTKSITYTENGKSVTKSLTVEQRGGEFTHKLIANEMPSHAHNWARMLGYGAVYESNHTGWVSTNASVAWFEQATGGAGGDAVHNNMPPYLAVYIYKRVG